MADAAAVRGASASARIVQIEPWIDAAELRELERAIGSTFLVEHDLTREFERQTARLTGCQHAIAVCNGSMALYISLKALGIGSGDEVIVPNLTFIATANAVIMAGATPVLCEIREDTFCLDVERAAELITARTRALMPVHLYGQSADMAAIMALARRHNLRVIEDAAEGVGVNFEGRHVGSFGDLGILSYYGNKTITCGEGGMVLTNDDDLAKATYRLKNYGRDRKGTFVHDSIGFNFSFTDLQAAVGLAQMKKMPAIVRRKRDIHRRYVDQLRGISGIRACFIDPRCQPVYWFTSFLCDAPDALAAALARRNIQTRRFFLPLHRQPCYVDQRHLRLPTGGFPVSDGIYHQGISLPSSYSLTDDDQSLVIEAIQSFYAHRS